MLTTTTTTTTGPIAIFNNGDYDDGKMYLFIYYSKIRRIDYSGLLVITIGTLGSKQATRFDRGFVQTFLDFRARSCIGTTCPDAFRSARACSLFDPRRGQNISSQNV